jgi:hypothetical protein
MTLSFEIKALRPEVIDKAYIAMCRKNFKKARNEREKRADVLLQLTSVGDLVFGLDVSPELLFYDPDTRLLMEEYSAAEKRETIYHDAYRKAKNCFRIVEIAFKRFWMERIRFASRAIGNMSDFNLITMPVPPTIVPADEYVMNYGFFIRQQGGASVGNPA